jgi:hypothetical protein
VDDGLRYPKKKEKRETTCVYILMQYQYGSAGKMRCEFVAGLALEH